ncbi:MAG: hypothetical protein K2X93_17755 [Candidatus Obscuribacterales bacterium]|nr:hypothetical protein [Candidatus Obscuribacterales bacterium]
MELQVVGYVLVATAASLSIVDCIPGNRPLKLKDLNTPEDQLASHKDVWKLLVSTKIED